MTNAMKWHKYLLNDIVIINDTIISCDTQRNGVTQQKCDVSD